VIAASSDFSDPDKFSEATNRQIIFFTSAGDNCESDPASVLAERWAELGDITVKVEFIGLGLTGEQEQQLHSMATAVEGRAFPVKSQEELDRLLKQLLDIEPVLEAVDQVSAAGNAIVSPLRDLRSANNRCDAVAAREASVLVDGALEDANPALDSVAGRDDRVTYQALHTAARAWADGLAEVSEVGRRWIGLVDDLGDAPDETACGALRSSEELGELVDQWNKAVGAANGLLGELNDHKRALDDELDQLLNS
jgi:hypothetical protein